MDGSWLYGIRREEAMRDWPLILKALEDRAAKGEPDDAVAAGFQEWKLLPTENRDLEHLTPCIDDAIEAKVRSENPAISPLSYFEEGRKRVRQHVIMSHRYWINFIFELLLLVGLGWFVVWPTIRDLRPWRHLLHLFVAPIFFLMPAWMGYCPFIVAGVGPAGGIVYPWLLAPFRDVRFDFPWDGPFFHAIPKLLDGINQGPAISWEDAFSLRISMGLVPGPFDAAIAGLGLCGTYLLFRLAAQYLRQKNLKRPNFEVLPAATALNTAVESAPRDLGRP
jgi:hypothetical protein